MKSPDTRGADPVHATELHPQTGWGGYQSLHDNLVAELETLLREDDDGVANINDEHTDRIASLSVALQSLNKLADLQERGAIAVFGEDHRKHN